jgi:uncharacterized protein (TIGR02598 family)
MRKPDSFSLVEVVLALGIFSFCVLTLLALMTTGMTSGHQSNDDTTLASVTTRMVNFVRDSPANSAFVAAGFTSNFTVEGQPPQAGGLPAYYTCKVSSKVNPTEPGLTNVTLVFSWPASSPKNAITNNVTIPPL